MVNWSELGSRIYQFLRFSKQELSGLIPAIFITAFIFSFQDWGDTQINLLIGLKNLFLVLIITAISFFVRVASQKAYSLGEGQTAEFKVWWTGLLIALILAFISKGWITLIIAGGTVSSFMVRQRLGEYRYGFNYWVNGMKSQWGLWANLILAILFALGLYFAPQSYFFHKGLILNMVMAFCYLLPIPQLESLDMYIANPRLYYFATFTVLLAAILLLSRTQIGLILAIIIAVIGAIIYILISSEK